MAVNAEKTFWAVGEVDYLGFKLTKNGVTPQPKKIAAITGMKPPRNVKDVRHFIGMVNYYRYMWKRRSHLLAPLSKLTGRNARFEWKEEQQRAFEEIKAAVSKEVLLSFPDYSLPFDLYTDASDKQMGAVLMQGKKTLAFWSRKLNGAQLNYGVGEKEMLSVVEALKEFRTMIFGYEINIYTDHKNWAYDKVYKNARVMRWRLEIEDFAPKIHYIKGTDNDVADAMSRLPIDVPASDFMYVLTEMEQEDLSTEEECFNIIEEAFDMNPVWRDFQQPLTLKEVGQHQATDQEVQRTVRQAPDSIGELFEDIGKKVGPDRVVTVKQDGEQRILVPEKSRKKLLNWYHETLLHPGANRMYDTLRQHYYWKNMKKDIDDLVKRCPRCQKAKRGIRGYGHVPIKDVETTPWKDIAVDLAGPWTATVDSKEVKFHTLTVMDVFTGWIEIIPIQRKTDEEIGDLFEREWLRRYPRPSRVIFDQGGEFDGEAFRAKLIRWYVKPEPTTTKNPRANAIVERVHRVMGDMIRIQLTKEYEEDNPIASITSAAAYAIRATVHGVTKYSPCQIVFRKDMILRTNVEFNVELIRQRKEAAIVKNNTRENKRRIAYRYKAGDKVLVLSGRLDPKLKLHQGPYRVVSYDEASGTLHIRRRNYIESINIRNVRPFFGKTPSAGGD